MPDDMTPGAASITFVEITADLVATHVERNHVGAADLPTLIATTHAARAGLGTAPEPKPAPAEPTPTMPIRKSVIDTRIISLEDGKPYQALKRHLR